MTRLLIRQKMLVKVDTLLFHEQALKHLKDEMATLRSASAPEQSRIDVAGFKERYGVTRKYAIPLLEDPGPRARDQAKRGHAEDHLGTGASLLVTIHAVLGCVLEVADGAANPSPDLGQPIGSEDQDDNRQDDQHLGQTNTSH